MGMYLRRWISQRDSVTIQTKKGRTLVRPFL